MTGDMNNPNAHEVEGMLATYQKAINSCDLSGPTLFTPLLTQVT